MRRFCVAIVSLIALLPVFQAKAVDGSPGYLTGRTAIFHVTNAPVSSYVVFFKPGGVYDLTRVTGKVQNETNVSYSYAPFQSTNATINGVGFTTVTNIKTTANSTNVTSITTSVTNTFGLSFTAPLGGTFTNQITIGIQTNVSLLTTNGPVVAPETSSKTQTNNQSGTFSMTDVTFDLNQDGEPDFLWQNFANTLPGANSILVTNIVTDTNNQLVTNITSSPANIPGTNFAVWELPTNITFRSVITNINANITPDLSVTNFETLFSADTFDYFMANTLEMPAKLGGRTITNLYPFWQIIGQADFDTNGIPDLVWRGQETAFYTNHVNGTTNLGFTYFTTNGSIIFILQNRTTTNKTAYQNPTATLVGLGNFTGGTTTPNGSLAPDFLFLTNITFGSVVTNGTTVTNRLVSTNYELFVVSYYDMTNGTSNPEKFLVTSKGTNVEPKVISTSFGVAGIADLNGDGWSDIIFTNRANSPLTVWYMQGTNFLRSTVVTNSVPSANVWKFQGVADFDHDGHPDFVYRSPVTDRVIINFMNGVGLRNTAHIIGPPAEWNLAAPK